MRITGYLFSAAVLWLALAGPQEAFGAQQYTDRIIVKFSSPTARAAARTARSQEAIEALAISAGIPGLRHLRVTHGGAQILQLPTAVPLAVANRLSRRMQDVEGVLYAQPDSRLFPLLVPNDPDYPTQWALADAASQAGATQAMHAWDTTTGSPEVTVAIVDTGILAHEDLAGRFLIRQVNGQTVPYGWDFIARDLDSSFGTANDGDGPDADPGDPGDWVSNVESGNSPFLGCLVTDSTWHGTHVSGILAARSNNHVGIAGLDWRSNILPVRVLGKCGGYLSDVFEGVRWAAGGEVGPLCIDGSGKTLPKCTEPPVNEHPARVINLSLGAQRSCGPFEQEIIDEVRAAGAVVVAAAGNHSSTSEITPASCNGVIAVAATGRNGDLASYSAYGPHIDIAAPGGDVPRNTEGIYSTLDGGRFAPQNDNAYGYYIGTSMAAPHVSGTLALMLAANRAGRKASGTTGWLSPQTLEAKLKGAARAFPVTGGCDVGRCGAGLLDAGRAVRAVSTPPVARADDKVVGVGDTVDLDGSGSHDDGRITRFQWQPLDADGPVLKSNPDGSVVRFATAAGESRLGFRLTVTDDVGLRASTDVTVTVLPAVPVLDPVADRMLSTGERLRFDIRASQADGGVPILTLASAPKGARLTDFGDGTARFEWVAEQAGTFQIVFQAHNPENTNYSDLEGATFSVRSSSSAASQSSGGGGGGAALWLVWLGAGICPSVRKRFRRERIRAR